MSFRFMTIAGPRPRCGAFVAVLWVGLGVGIRPTWAQTGTGNAVVLPLVEIFSARVANQEPVSTFAMPVSALRFEPTVDVQARNFAEGQADIAIRGGTFANTGISVGAAPLYDPQTGHYTAELPLAPAMLAAPDVRVGSAQALSGGRGTAGSVGYAWRPITAGGSIGGAVGTYQTENTEVYSAVAGPGGWAADIAAATSRSAGTIEHGDHDFSRANLRLQHRDAMSDTNVAVGYQAKFFGWPNLYTPFNSPETEDLETVLVVANHRREWAGGSQVEAGAYYRRNKDDYAFNRFAPVPAVHPFQHTTWVYGSGARGRWQTGREFALNWAAELTADEIESTSLRFGRFKSRTQGRLAAYPERRWAHADGGEWVATGGAAWEESNRDGGALLPMLELAREDAAGGWSRWALAYTATSQVPSYTALNSSTMGGLFRGNPDLGRSLAHTLDFRLTGQVKDWQIEAAAFWRRDDALVDWVFRRGVTARAARAVDLDTFGLEMFARRSWRALDLLLGYGWLHKEANYGDTMIDGSFYALNFPEHRITVAITWRALPGLEVRFDNEARWQADNPLRRVGGDEAVISALGVYWRPRAAPGWRYSLEIDNLWNTNFEEVPATPAGNRLVSVGARYGW